MKKLLSIILAITMIAALIPSAFAAEKNIAVHDNSVQFLLKPQAYGQTYISGGYLSNYGYEQIVSGGKWKVGLKGVNSTQLYNEALQFNEYIKNDVTTGKKKYDAFYLDINMKSEKTGAYVPYLTFETGNTAPIFDVYFYESTASESSENRIGTIDLYSATVEKKTVCFDEVSISADKEYILRFRAVGANSAIDMSGDKVLLQARVTGFSFVADTSVQAIENGALTYIMGTNALNTNKMWNSNNSLTKITNDVDTELEGLRYMTELRYFPYVDWKFETTVTGTDEYDEATQKTTDNTEKGISETPYKTMNLEVTDPYRVDTATSQMTDIYSLFVMYSPYFQSRTYWAKVDSEKAAVPSLVLRINVPYAGKYNLKLSGTKHANGIISDVYFGKAEDDTATAKTRLDRAAIATKLDKAGVYHTNKGSKEDASISFADSTVESAVVNAPAAGEYWVAFLCNVAETEKHTNTDSVSTRFFILNKVELEPIENDYIKAFDITFDKNSIEAGKNTSVQATAVSSINGERTVEATAIDYACSDLSVATIDANGNITGVAPGTAAIFARMKETGNVATARITVTEPAPAEDTAISDAFETEEPTLTVYNPSVSGAGYNASEGMATVEGITKTLQSNGSYKMYAPEKNGDAQFLYWAKGLSAYKKIVSYENEFYYTPAGEDNNFLIAVYDNADSSANKAEFYNANGQLIKLITDTSEDKTVPALPSMAGYNSASEWKQYNGETEVTVGSELTPTGTMIFVAQYELEEPAEVTVTVKDGKGTATVPYGEVVTCTPIASNGIFKWWKKEVNGVSEIVSIDDEYSFLAWENCTVTAEYDTKKPVYTGSKMKIIIDSFKVGDTENGVMAEFIGFGEDTVEKGIMHNGTKIAMTKPGNQFTVTGKLNDTFKGYAIVKNGENYNLIVDGEVTLTNAE